MTRFFSRVIALIICTGALIASASAADLPIYKSPPPSPIDPWTGFYFGGFGGYGWGTKTFLDNFPTPDLALDAKPSVRGALGGLQIGYNYHINWLVIGAEGDFAWSGVKNGSFSCFTFGNQNCSAHPEWFSTATARVGLALGGALIYAKGGAAWVGDSYSDIATCSGGQAPHSGGIPALCGDPFVANDLRFGWTVGGGIEYQFARNWSIWAEYDFMNFGSRSVPFTDGGNGYFTELIYQNVNLVKVGVNYRFSDFGWSGSSGFLADAAADAGAADDKPTHIVSFAGVDVAKLSFDGYAGGMIAPYTDLNTSGPRMYILGDGGWYKYYDSTGAAIKGVSISGDFLGGYAFEADNYSLNFLAGFNAENDTLSTIDPTNKVVGTELGFKVRTDDFYNPMSRIQIHYEGEFATTFDTYYTVGSAGYDFFNNSIYIGPDVGTLGNERFKQFRAGLIVAGIKFKNIQFDVSGGYANDSVVGPGAFGRIEASTEF